MSGEVSEKSWATGGCLAGWRTADEGQRNAECKVRKGLKGEDEARGKIKKKKKSGYERAAESASPLCARQEGGLA